MAKLSEVLDAEKYRSEPDQQRQILLWPDGSFFRAYEWSAWLCVRYVKQFKPTRREIKSVGTDMIFVGFPKTSLERFTTEGLMDVQTCDDGRCILTLREELVMPDNGSTLEQDYQNWRNTISITPGKEKEKDSLRIPANPVSLTGIMKRILEFPVESSTPIDCMQFIAELKRQASSML